MIHVQDKHTNRIVERENQKQEYTVREKSNIKTPRRVISKVRRPTK